MPVFLLYAYSKADRSDLGADKRADLKKLTKKLVEQYRSKNPLRSVR